MVFVGIFFDRLALVVWSAILIDAILQIYRKRKNLSKLPWRAWGQLVVALGVLIIDGVIVVGDLMGFLKV